MLELTGVCKAQDGQRLLESVDLALSAHELAAISGPSGAGKTTLLRLIAGLEQFEAGGIRWRGQVLSGPARWVPPWQRPFAMVFQDFGLWPHLTVADHLNFVLRSRRDITARDRKRVCQRWLAELHIDDLSHRYPAELSGGQQQRVAIARSLARGPELLLLDEAFSHLDPAAAQTVWLAISNWRQEARGSVLAVTHDTEWIVQHAARWFVLEHGSLRSQAVRKMDPGHTPPTAYAGQPDMTTTPCAADA